MRLIMRELKGDVIVTADGCVTVTPVWELLLIFAFTLD